MTRENNKWITFGGSYPGSLSALLRVKHPDLVHGAFASSAPMNFKLDFNEYAQVLGRTIESYDKQCRYEIEKATRMLEKLLRTFTGAKKVAKIFG